MNDYPEVVEKIIDDYLQRLKLQLRRVPAREKEEFLREIQSHLYEAYQQEPGEDDIARAFAVLRKLGEPAEVVSDRLPGAMVGSGTKRNLPVYVIGGILIALFGAPLGFSAVAVLAGVLAALTGFVAAYYAAAGMMFLVSLVAMLLGLTRIYEPATWDRLIAAGFIQLNGPPARFFEVLSPGTQGFVFIVFAAAFAAAGLGMLWLGRYLFLGLRFLYGWTFDGVRKTAQTVRCMVRARSYRNVFNTSCSADSTAAGFSWGRK